MTKEKNKNKNKNKIYIHIFGDLLIFLEKNVVTQNIHFFHFGKKLHQKKSMLIVRSWKDWIM